MITQREYEELRKKPMLTDDEFKAMAKYQRAVKWKEQELTRKLAQRDANKHRLNVNDRAILDELSWLKNQ